MNNKTVALKSTMDRSGRLVFPEILRQAAGLEPGMPLEARLFGDHLEIEPAEATLRAGRRQGPCEAAGMSRFLPDSNCRVAEVCTGHNDHRATVRDFKARQARDERPVLALPLRHRVNRNGTNTGQSAGSHGYAGALGTCA